MQRKIDADATTAEKTLRLYHKLLLDSRRHFQTDLAEYLRCSVQTVMRLIAEIERVIGANLVTGLEKHRRWYQIRSLNRNRLGLEYEELRYLAICRDLAEPYLPEKIRNRVDESLFSFSMLMAEQEFVKHADSRKSHMGYCAKGRIDYTPYVDFLEKLVRAADEDRVCLVLYKALKNDRDKEHKFACGRLVCMNNAIYALGASLTDDFRGKRFLISLAVHRMKDVTVTDKKWHVEIPEDDLGMFGLPWHEPRSFRIHFHGESVVEYVRERIWSDRQHMEMQPDGSLVLEMVSRSEPEVRAWVRGFGEYARLLDEGRPADQG